MARPSLFGHRKFARLSRLLGAQYRAVGILEMIWQRAYQDGEERLGSCEDVEFVVGWDGEPGVCSAALIDAGFVDVLEDGQLGVHDLYDHAPDYVRKRQSREAQRRTVTSQRPDSDRSVTGRCQTMDRTPAPAPAPAHIEDSLCSEPQADSELKDAVLLFPVKGGEDWGFSQKLADALKEAYPGIDVLAEARKARVWLISNPVKMKTRRGMSRFLTNWIERANNKGTAAGQEVRDPLAEFNAKFERLAGRQ